MRKVEKIYANFEKVHQLWQQALAAYTEQDLLKKETMESWTLGQVYLHLIHSTLDFHLKQIQTCLTNATNKKNKKNFKGFLAYNLLNGFPPIKIKVPPSDFYTPKQPDNKEAIQDGLLKVKKEMATILVNFSNDHSGKTVHPGFAYLNAKEWYQLVEMHWRHHLRQKAAIDKKQ
jgi:hypothetical protein